ncbi:MAG TPA: hypothetical protein VEA81_00310 [Burkholderiaceae bacterium]|nr:hypothetical protein [Burkholderiaceae bacterium]
MDAARRLRTAAADVAELRALDRLDARVRDARTALRAWQAARLAHTHGDLLAQPRYAAATRFFLDELYGAKDFSQRDAELARLIPTLARLLPESALETIAGAVELDALSERLDLATARAIAADPAVRAAGTGRGAGAIDDETYARAYRAAGSRADRERQIELVDRIGRSLDGLVRQPLLGGLLRAMETPARLAGLSAMHEFLASGFAAFRAMRGADAFLRTVAERETELMRRVYAGVPDPFRRTTAS